MIGKGREIETGLFGTLCVTNEVDRPVLQVQAAVREKGTDHLSTRTLLPRSTSSNVTAREV